ITTGISQHINEDEIKIFPNPAKELVNVSLNRKGNTTLNLMDASGRLVRTFHVSTAQSQLSLEGLESGVYFLKMEGENRLVRKIIKE
ncbi:MAG: T9SS type A sorting domain-containing protein, partial [Bacteroidota bacterium]